jgi:hypothetical protein
MYCFRKNQRYGGARRRKNRWLRHRRSLERLNSVACKAKKTRRRREAAANPPSICSQAQTWQTDRSCSPEISWKVAPTVTATNTAIRQAIQISLREYLTSPPGVIEVSIITKKYRAEVNPSHTAWPPSSTMVAATDIYGTSGGPTREHPAPSASGIPGNRRPDVART